jgi:hypothetical protein
MIKFPYKRIISYGCSITAGTELGDAALLGMTEDQLADFVRTNQVVGNRDLYGKLGVTQDTIVLIDAVNASFSWPNYVARRFNVPLENRAIGGSSLSSATNEILKDLHNSNINADDLILVGITGPGRWFQYNEDGSTGGGVIGWGWPNTLLEYQTQLENNFFNKYNLLYNHYKELAFISNLSDTLNGQIKMCYALNSPYHFEIVFRNDLKEKKFAEFYNFCLNICPTHHFLENTRALNEILGITGERHPFGHPKVKYHKKFANMLIKKLEEMYSD